MHFVGLVAVAERHVVMLILENNQRYWRSVGDYVKAEDYRVRSGMVRRIRDAMMDEHVAEQAAWYMRPALRRKPPTQLART